MSSLPIPYSFLFWLDVPLMLEYNENIDDINGDGEG